MTILWKLKKNSRKLVKLTTRSWNKKIKNNFSLHRREVCLEISQSRWISFSAQGSCKRNQNIIISHLHRMLNKGMGRKRKLQLRSRSRKMGNSLKWSGTRTTTQTEVARWPRSMTMARTSRRNNSWRLSSWKIDLWKLIMFYEEMDVWGDM